MANVGKQFIVSLGHAVSIRASYDAPCRVSSRNLAKARADAGFANYDCWIGSNDGCAARKPPLIRRASFATIPSGSPATPAKDEPLDPLSISSQG
jgi:hypothetical protein